MNEHTSSRIRAVVFLLALGLVVAPPQVRAQEENDPSPPALKDVDSDSEEYRFLTLGEGKDYLRAERWRIIDQVEQAIPPLYEPIRPFHGYTLPPGAVRIGLGVTFGRNPGDFGTDDLHALFFDNVEINFVKVNLDLLYGFEVGPLRDLVIRLNLPYKFQRHSGTGHPFRIAPMEMTMHGSGNGIGDVSLTLKKKWIDQGNGLLNFSTMVGAIFPTAQDNEEFDAEQTIFMNGEPVMAVSAELPGNPAVDIFGRGTGDLLFPRVAQPGNGSWGARFGFGATHQFERSAIHAGLVFDLLADNDGITPGNELRYGLSYTLPPTASDRVTLDLAVVGRWKGDEKFPGTIIHPERDPATGGPMMDANGDMMMFVTPRPDFDHGHAMFISPSLVFITSPNSRLVIGPTIRIREPQKGPSPRWAFTVANTLTF